MSLKMLNDDGGLTYTLEAILGVFLILGTVLFTTASLPYTAQKTGEHSKVQLVNIGRDALDLVELTPITDIFDNYSRSQGVNRQYTLVADKTLVEPNGIVNFTVYYMDTNETVKEALTLERTILGLKTPPSNGTMSLNNGSETPWDFSTIGEYDVRAYNGSNPSSPIAWSNYVTIKVGYYFLETDINGIYQGGDLNVSGIVYDSNSSGVPNLSVQILDSNGQEAACGGHASINPVNTTTYGGNFSFIWPTCLGSGSYYIQAKNTTSGITSSKHRIIYSSTNNGGVICCDSVINETESVVISLTTDSNFDFKPIGDFNINQIFYKDVGGSTNASLVDKINLDFLDPNCRPGSCKEVVFTGYVAGDYYIFYGNTGQGRSENDPAKASKTNGILIRVLPFQGQCLFGNCKPKCSGLEMTELSLYMRRFVPQYVNYNLYLISPDGTICKDCPEFKEIINGYPTDEAVTVNKIFHLRIKDKARPTNYLERMRELRMVLWYK